MNYTCKYISDEWKDEWEKLVDENLAGGFNQSFAWTNFKRSLRWKSYKIGLFSNSENELIGGAVLLKYEFSNGTNLFYIPEGPILDYENPEEAKIQWAILYDLIEKIVKSSSSVCALRIEPRINKLPSFFTYFVKAPKNLQPQNTQVINLADSETDLLANMKQKCRYNVKLAERKGVEVRVLDDFSDENIDIFYELYSQTFERKGLEPKKKSIFKKFGQYCSSISKLYIAEYKENPIAAAFVIYFGNRATYLYGGSDDEYKKVMASYLLHWRIIQDAKKMRYKEYDLFGISPASASEHQWKNITRFKKGFGGESLKFTGAYDLIYEKSLYKKFVETFEIVN